GFIDYGFDILHPALSDASGLTRFDALLDQNARQRGAGGEWDASALQRLVDAARAARARQPADSAYDPHAHHCGAGEPIAAHGTVVASIAAGSPRGGFRGAAPQARLIGVHLALGEEHWKEQDADGVPMWSGWRPQRQPAWDGWRSYDDC